MINRKKRITFFCIALYMLILCRNIMTATLLPILLIGMLCGSCIYISKHTGKPQRYRLCFLLSMLFAIATYFCQSALLVSGMTVFFIVFAMLALYRIQYPALLTRAVLRNVQQNMCFLLFAYVNEYFLPDNSLNEEKKRRSVVRIAVGLSALLVIVLGILFSIAEKDFVFIVQMMVYSLYTYLPQIVMSCIGGVFLAIVLYGFSVGLLQNKVKENTVEGFGEHNKTSGCGIQEFFYNETSLSFMLCVILTANLLIIVIEIYHYWVMLSLQAELGIRESGYHIILVCLCIESTVCLAAHNYVKNDMRESLGKRTIVAAISKMIILFMAVIRYARHLYEAGIHKNNSWQLYFFIFMFLFDLNFLAATLNVTKKIWGEGRGCMIAIIFAMIALLWNANWFPEYNAKLFLYKYENGKFADEDQIPRAQLNLEEMIKTGESAVPALLSLAEVQALYGDSGERVGDVALQGVLSIYRIELDDLGWAQFSDISYGEKIEAIVYRLRKNPFYAYGMRNRILESLESYLKLQSVFTN